MKLKVDGMSCGHCVRAIEQAIAAIGGTAQVDLEAKTVTVEGSEDAAAIRRAIAGEGYTVLD